MLAVPTAGGGIICAAEGTGALWRKYHNVVPCHAKGERVLGDWLACLGKMKRGNLRIGGFGQPDVGESLAATFFSREAEK